MVGRRSIVGALLAAALLAGCGGSPSAPEEPTGTSPTAGAAAIEYDLGPDTLVQGRFDQDSPFREMPVRLNGMRSSLGATVT